VSDPQQRDQPLRRWGALRAIMTDSVLLAGLVFGLIVIAIIFGMIRLGAQEGLRLSRAGRVIGGPPITYIIAYAPMLYVSARRIGRAGVRIRLDPAAPAVLLGIGMGAAIAIAGIAYNFAIVRLFGRHALPDMLRELREAKGNLPLLTFIVFAMVIVAPVCEELFFRAALFGSASAAGQGTLGAIVSSLLFALSHGAPYLIVYYFASGIVFCLLFKRLKTLLAPIAAHSAVNAIACLLTLYSLHFRH
jgi:membrane protease YdiL (CAAX protease family)